MSGTYEPITPERGAHRSVYDAQLMVSEPVSVVSLGVVCHLDSLTPGSISCALEEFARLDNGTVITIRMDRGVGVSLDTKSYHDVLTEDELRDQVAIALLPDEGVKEDEGEPLPWHEFAELLAARGVLVAPDELRALPFEFQLQPQMQEVVTSAGREERFGDN
ncbi:hypothetical protein [Microbacterium excoecariae]|uniref:hypothetical protein n=1 Tax=Microbacterium excoecariae TaxID=2715210 RepID=UPI001409DFBA|nr:hypothetical protein [Microbacterium excoecariae]NHI17069.1 hypothetical protein [Microbacterium excoecariae]